LTKEQILQAADYLLVRWLQGSHDGDSGGPPDFIRVGEDTCLSLAETFEAFAFTLDYWVINESLPEKIAIKEILGPVNYPMYELGEEPKFDPEKVHDGWLPFELKEEYFPDRETVASQGLGVREGGFPYVVFTNAVNILHSAWLVSKEIRREGWVPAMIPLYLPMGNERRDVKVNVNPTEFLYAMAQIIRVIHLKGLPREVLVASMKIIRNQTDRWIMPSTPVSFLGGRMMSYMTQFNGFEWRAKVPKWLINATWTYKPKSDA
jgi:hypothetical protein